MAGEPDYRAQAIELLTNLLVEAEEGRVRSLTVVYRDETGAFNSRFTGCESRSVEGAQLFRLAMERMGFVMKSELNDFVRRDEL